MKNEERHLGGRASLLPRLIRTASAPAELRALFARLPAFSVRAHVPDADAVPPVGGQLLKLAALVGALDREAPLPVEPGPFAVTFSRGDLSLRLEASDLAMGLRSVCQAVIERLFPAPVLAEALASFASEAAMRSTMRALTSMMLRAPDLDHALYAMLSGVTSGQGLAFHRAALFLVDRDAGGFTGWKAIGPADELEAHRIWEEMESEDKELSQLVFDYARGNVDNRFETFVRGLRLSNPSAEGDEVRRALAADGPVLFTSDAPENASLHALRPARSFVLAPVARRVGEEAPALLFADDAWSKEPILPERVTRLADFLEELTLVWQNIALLERVEKLARTDALTGVHNRRVFEERLRDEHSRAKRTGAQLTVLILDVDRFKEINDTRGHAAGDDALRKLASLLAETLREHDTVARFGGDEFAVLLPGISRDEALAVARRLGEAARRQGVSVSVGGATLPTDGNDAKTVMAAADANLYAAKRAGRGRARIGEVLEVDFGAGSPIGS